MADNEHRMLFDIRGRRKNVVKVVYAVLAVLMGASLFVAVGPFNIGELFNSNSVGDAAEPYEEQAERVEAKLKKDPDNPALLLTLTRAHVNAGNAQYQEESNGEKVMTVESYQEFQEASDSWNSYLAATEEPPNPALAQLMAFTLVQLAENSRSFTETQNNIAAATEAQEIVAKQRPTLNSLSTLALYSYFDGNYAAAEKARTEASKLANSKAEREQLDKSLDETKKRAEKFQQEVKRAEKQSKAQGAAGGGGESLENPLGGGLNGGTLGE